jgi:hypothetical protein
VKLLALVALVTLATRARAQDPRLARLDPAARGVVVGLVDSARAAGLPAEPLVQRALEGVTKRAPADRIILAVRRLARDLGAARTALGPDAVPAELEAGAAALRAGASPMVLVRLRRARHSALTVPLAVLADLVASGVPVDSAAAAVLALAPTAKDGDLVEFRRAVERDIALGVPPGAAAGILLNADARSARPGRP